MIESFWHWFFHPTRAAKTGWKLIVTPWLLLHAIIALFMCFFLEVDGFVFASKALFPAASILISMAIAWTARAATILNDEKFRRGVLTDDQPLEDYIYGYQISLLIIISTVVYISIMASGGIKIVLFDRGISVFLSSFWLYLFLSMSIRECWGVINFSNLLALLSSRIPK